jgi:hypothetical protein
MGAARSPHAVEFLVPGRQALAGLNPGMKIAAGFPRRGGDRFLEHIRRIN